LNNLNRVELTGNLTRDSETKYTSGGLAILSFSIAVNRSVKDGDGWKQEASFFDCKAFGKIAEWRSGLTKGQAVLVAGELRQERWEKDGQSHSKVVIIAEALEKLQIDKKGDAPARQEAQDHGDGFADDIPF
jgi:single-strand DNA-binding protein